jgi:hypothetical protein
MTIAETCTEEYRVEITNPSGSRSYLYFTVETAERARELAEWHYSAMCLQGTVTDVTEDF